jgi:hypothetical protein
VLFGRASLEDGVLTLQTTKDLADDQAKCTKAKTDAHFNEIAKRQSDMETLSKEMKHLMYF